jgi:hypothetical protein
MRRSAKLCGVIGGLALGLCLSGSAAAFEFPLQFTPAAGARNLVVAGYAFGGGKVSGNCSYSITRSGSGRGARSYTTYFNQTCGWDLHGNLLSVVSGAPTAPAPLSSVGGLTIYARDAAGDTTGVDLGHGFVNVPSPLYSWAQPSGGYLFLASQAKATITLTVQSVGDLPLAVTKVTPSANLAKVSVKSTTCLAAPLAPGGTCSVVITYDPSAIPAGDDPYTAYDKVSVTLVSNSGLAPAFSETVETPIAPG